ncbi:aspartate--tRNA ligase [Mycoplasma sp. ATU-Cv-508]|uniref:aspartate--tRNA ligase n=1 Tax=Mycoplasma sp. ATU-Cv-508 TaxID=2048001 RepID=UPI000FDD2831
MEVSGKVVARKTPNPRLSTGQIEVEVQTVRVLSRAKNLPFVVDTHLSAKVDTKLKHRYLDLRRSEMQSKLMFRHRLIKNFRDYLDAQDFVEIETPYLAKSTPEGARDFLVPSRYRGKFFALPQSPQLYKQLLMASGFDRYYQVARVFRDEDNRKDRQPEFTQLDLETTYASQKSLKQLVEKMLVESLAKLGLAVKIPFPTLDYRKSMDLYGTDRPDCRFGLHLNDLSDFFHGDKNFKLDAQASVKSLNLEQSIEPSVEKMVREIAQKNRAEKIWFVNAKNAEKLPWMQKLLTQLGPKVQTCLVVVGSPDDTNQALGAIRNYLAEKFELFDPKKLYFLWVEKFPLFERELNTSRWTSLHHPFTMPTQPQKLLEFSAKDNLGELEGQTFDLVLNGYEVGGGSIRIHELELQKKVFQLLGLSSEVVSEKFGFFLEAFEYGLPPHGVSHWELTVWRWF